MVGCVPRSFSRVKACFACGSRGHRQIADADIHANHFGEVFTGWLCYVDGEGNEQIERLLVPVIPEFRVTDGSSGSDEGEMLLIALVGETRPPAQRSDTDPAVTLKGVIALIGVLDRWRTVRGGLVQALKAFLGDLGPAMLPIL